ncbi:hypothetical protein SSX86_016879 [Deinandra increscens subsp. villosa]|uniref:J domain-containing protein n=1 Tax=Deinandra increscens subsp. villosa TaxID=3103831 RepID=A0AAP0D190_9ASTR
MGKKSGWLSAIRKALRTPDSNSKEKKDKKSHKKSSKRYWFGKQRSVGKNFSHSETTLGNTVPLSLPREANLTSVENEQSEHAYSVAYATAMAAEAAVAAVHAAAEFVRLTSTARFSGKSTEEMAAIKIQTAYRRHLARRALRGVRGLRRLQSLVQGQSVKRQATSTLKCMHTLACVRSEVRSRRVRMSEENKVLQQFLLKHEKELNNTKSFLGNTWDDSRKSQEETEASLQKKQEAVVRRERALAYAHTHQQMWKNSKQSPNPTFLDSNNPHWGWSWLERWMAARPWEAKNIPDKLSSVGETSKLASCQSPSTPLIKARSSSSRIRPESRKGSVDEDDSRSLYSLQSGRNGRHSLASSVYDGESLESSPVVPNYMASTMSAKARSRMASPVHSPSPLGSEKGSVAGSAKKQLLFSGSPARTTTSVLILEFATPFIAGLAIAAAAMAGKYGIQAWHSLKTKPLRPRSRRFYEGGFQPTMTRREAALILGVRESVAADKVREAHRRVMVANHPDAGGSHYLASKINEAKDVMLRKTKNGGSAF